MRHIDNPVSHRVTAVLAAACCLMATFGLAGCVSPTPPPTPVAQPVAQAQPPRPTERRDPVTARGYAVISVQQHVVPAQQRLMAIRASRLDAYRGLAEQVYGQYLDATTTVADMIVSNDSFRARVEGIIFGATVVSITPIGTDTYETMLSLDATSVNDLRHLYLEQLAVKPR